MGDGQIRRHRVLLSEDLAADADAWLDEHAEVTRCRFDDPAFADHLAHAEGLIVRTYTRVDGSLVAAAPKLRVVGRAGVGVDNIDLAACRERNITVVYTPDANTQAVLEYVTCLLGDALRPRAVVDGPVASAQWQRLRAETVGVRQMSEMTLGILGLGRIGRRLAQVAAAIGFDVIFNDLLDIPEDQRFGAESVAPVELFHTADVLSIHIDGRPSNRHFVNSDRIGQMKSDVVFINTSRGFVIDHQALADFLRDHPAALAMLDVHEQEPIDDSNPLLDCANARLYPHLASRTHRALQNMSWVVRDVVNVLEGGEPKHPAPEYDT